MIDSTRQLVFVLSETKPLPTVLTIFNAQGENRKNPCQSVDFFIQNKSNVKQEAHHVAIFNDVIFTFSSYSGCLLRSLLNPTLNKLSVYPRRTPP